jgi:hypothetical protein
MVFASGIGKLTPVDLFPNSSGDRSQPLNHQPRAIKSCHQEKFSIGEPLGETSLSCRVVTVGTFLTVARQQRFSTHS